jgi:hypothetical protein
LVQRSLTWKMTGCLNAHMKMYWRVANKNRKIVRSSLRSLSPSLTMYCVMRDMTDSWIGIKFVDSYS